MLKQKQKPLSDDQIFLSSSTEQITWGELHANLDAKIERNPTKSGRNKKKVGYCFDR